MFFALAAAGATVAFGLGIASAPALNTCTADPRGFVDCLRDLADRRFDLPWQAPVATGTTAVAPDLRAAEPATPTTPAALPVDPVEVGGPAAPAEIGPAEVQGAPATAVEPAATPPVRQASTPDQPFVPPSPPAAVDAASPAPPAGAPPDQPDDGTAYAEPVRPVPEVVTAAPLMLPPTIDTIEFDSGWSYISGAGPAGAVIRLYADGRLVGESPVEKGRWLVETGPILTQPRRELKVEAVEPETGKTLGEAAITVEVQLPETAVPDETEPAPKPIEPTPEPTAPAPPTEVEPAPQEPQSELAPVPPADDKQPQLPPGAQATTRPAEVPAGDEASLLEPHPAAREPLGLDPLPRLERVSPDRESASVTVLRRPAERPQTLPLPAVNEDEPTVVELPRPDHPALIAAFRLPEPEKTPAAVSSVQLYPSEDPVFGRFAGGTVVIKKGDTLWGLAHRYYGAGKHYRTILKANRDVIGRASRIYPGQVLRLPIVTEN